MKLFNYTFAHMAVAMLFMVALWGAIFHFIMLHEVKKSLDEGLLNSKFMILQKVESHPRTLSKTKFAESNYTIKQLHGYKGPLGKNQFKDTSIYMHNDGDYEPARMLKTVFDQNGDVYELKIVSSMVQEDDLISGLFKGMLFLYISIVLSSLALNQYLVRKIWLPFHQLLDKLRAFQPDKNLPLPPTKTGISEFREMDRVISAQTKQISEAYHSQKQFLENMAHELQTPIAISINRLELLIEEDLGDGERAKIVQVIGTLERMGRLNKSLLLLSRIENRQFAKKEKLDVNGLVRFLIQEFEDLIRQKGITLSMDEKANLVLYINRDLAAVLFSNLLRNAIMHNKEGGQIRITLEDGLFFICNDGQAGALQETVLYARFSGKAKSREGVGLGLAICKAICDSNDLHIAYRYQDMHGFFLSGFPK